MGSRPFPIGSGDMNGAELPVGEVKKSLNFERIIQVGFIGGSTYTMEHRQARIEVIKGLGIVHLEKMCCKSQIFFAISDIFITCITENKLRLMIISKRAARKFLSTWPQRLAISGLIAFIIWNFTDENLIVFSSVVLFLHFTLSMVHSRIREPKPTINEEYRY